MESKGHGSQDRIRRLDVGEMEFIMVHVYWNWFLCVWPKKVSVTIISVLVYVNLQIVSLCLPSNTYLKMSSPVSILLREKQRHLFLPVTIPRLLTIPLLSPRLQTTGMRILKNGLALLQEWICAHCLLLSLSKEHRTQTRQRDRVKCVAGDNTDFQHQLALPV